MPVLITGASGSQEQAEAVKEYDVLPFTLDLRDEKSVTKNIVDAQIFVVYFLVDAVNCDMQIPLIKALGDVKKQTGREVHFLHTTGAKMFSEHAGMPTDRRLVDTDPALYDLQKSSKSPHELFTKAANTNITVIETAEKYGVRSYIFVPCIVYGEGKGFGNKISIQTVAVVTAAKGSGTVYDVNPEDRTWPVCHIDDNTKLYVKLLKSILSGENSEYGKDGYYLASSGSMAWYDIYAAMAKALAKHAVISSPDVERADDAALDKMAQALGCPKDMVAVQLGGKCTFEAKRAYSLGWRPDHAPEHIVEVADAEVELILNHIGMTTGKIAKR
ncbi:nad-binding protein [Alternaria burnsii]|uniref:Nad-binding protein n=1 Tax=Alternaria burnsii TaxID=1187904 RepID=A0A8H7B499_9PLEO|nr:nad-binding protein [Alternaria burnsii]KAF7675063.1 nad-binding protein [Alternaria burnsii]